MEESSPLTPTVSPPRRRSYFSLMLLPTLLIYVFLLTNSHYWARLKWGMIYPWQLDGEEGFLLNQALELRDLHSIYQPIRQEPYLVGNYPPIYQALNALFVSRETPTLLVGRFINFLSAFGIAFLLFFNTYRLSRRVILSVLAPLLFLASYEVHNWVPFFRVDILAIFFSVVGLTFFLDLENAKARRWATAFMLLGIYTKQTALLVPAACFLFLLFHRPRLAPRFVLVFAAWALGIFTLLTLLTRGEYYLHTIKYNENLYSWWQMKVWLRHLFRFYPYYILALMVLLLYRMLALLSPSLWPSWKESKPEASVLAEFYETLNAGENADAQPKSTQEDSEKTGESSSPSVAPEQGAVAGVKAEAASSSCEETPASPHHFRLDLVTCYFLVAVASLLTLGKEGAAPNYILEPLVAFSLFLTVTLHRLLELSEQRRVASLYGVTIFPLLGVILFVQAIWLVDQRGALFSSRVPGVSDMDKADAVSTAVEHSKGEIIAEEPIFLLENHRRVLFQPFIMSQLAKEGRWDQKPFVEDLARGRFSLIITTQDIRQDGYFFRWTPEMVQAIRDAYELDRALERGGGTLYYIYRPKEAPFRSDIVIQPAGQDQSRPERVISLAILAHSCSMDSASSLRPRLRQPRA
ncbi:MAG: hypothetical protein V2A74_08600 [bacterium]